ncbi:DUF3784 domain-containing protein [Bacillus infantis]|uniref:DUF3784 domain-containing protein n=1 Tax=Bacillus infantis TaxID=324767 RepID=UPI0020A233B5|nr:DUF3784 domain-containing protein [Bacillus infantis]MCP1156744.1 DUF3784 domain-containing protein [Bacillus infantis]
MWFLAGIQVFVIVLFSILGWAIRYKKNYWLISGFAGRPAAEQEELIQNKMPQKTGGLLLATAIGMLILLPLAFTGFTYAMEVQIGFMLLFLLGGSIYLSKFEIPRKRKRMYWFTSILSFAVIGFIIGLTYLGYQKPDLSITEETFEITGMYGDEWPLESITKIELLEEMPEVTWKENGFGLSTLAKGRFTVEGYGSSLLFIHKKAPYIYIEMGKKHIFINGENEEQTLNWHEQLANSVE